MDIERVDYNEEGQYWTVWGVVSAPNFMVIGVHTVYAPSDYTIEQLASTIDAMYLE